MSRADGVIAVSVESGSKKVFARAIDWPGWARSGKTEALALAALAAYASRYRVVATTAGEPFDPMTYEVVERSPGGTSTDFGVPSAITDLDRRSIDDDEASRRASLVAAAWAEFDRVATAAPAGLRKGPRGGGRDRDKIVAHVIGADHVYAREVGHRGPEPDPGDRPAVAAERAAVLAILRQRSDGSALAGRRWTTRYAATRIAWHALDHAWEIEDRTDPA